jgi:hypothetical protein
MSTSRVLLTALTFSVGTALTAHADGISLNVRPGLWEMTTSGQSSGTPPIPAELLASMPPERRAKIEAAMAASMARSNASHTFQQCVTPESLKRGIEADENKGGRSCTQRIVSSNGSAMDIDEECSGRERVSGKIHFEAASPEAMDGSVNLAMTDGVHAMTIKRVIKGKWLGADCGSVKAAGQ